MDLDSELKNYLKECGAPEVGYADLRDFPDSDYPSGISIFIKLPRNNTSY